MVEEARKKLFLSRLEALRQGKHTDCVFLAGSGDKKQEIHAVKGMMMMTSGFMQGLFDSPICPPNPIRIDSVEPEILQLIVEFVHLTELITPVSCEEAVSLAIAADQLIIDSLREYSISLIQEKINPSNIWTSLDKILAHNLEDVAAACSSMLHVRTIECMEIEGFVTASKASVVFLLKQNELALDSEAQLVDYCITWASEQEDASVLLSLIPHMRLLTFVPSVAAHLCECLKLQDKEKAAILEYTITQKLPEKFPSTLCASTSPRLFPFKELQETLIPNFLTVAKKTDALKITPESIIFKSNAYAIVNNITLSPKINIFLTGFSGLGLMKANEGIEFNSQTGVYETKKDPDLTFSCSVSVKGLDGKDENFNLYSLSSDTHWTVKLKQPILLKKSAVEYSVTVHFSPLHVHSGTYFLKNIAEVDVNEALVKSTNCDIFNMLKVSWTMDCHSGRTFGPHGPIFLKNFSYIIDPDYWQINNE